MEEWKEEWIILERKEDAFTGIGGRNFIWKGNFVGISKAGEQQLQMQKCEHGSSPQSLECCS